MKKRWKGFLVCCAAVGLIGLAIALSGMALGGRTALTMPMEHGIMIYRPWGSALYSSNGSIERGLVDNLVRLARYGDGLGDLDPLEDDDGLDAFLDGLEGQIEAGIEAGIENGIENFLGDLDEQIGDWAEDWDWSEYEDRAVNQWFEKGEVMMGPVEKQTLEQITDLDITAVSADVKIQQGSEYTLTILPRNKKLEVGYQMQQGRLVIKERKVPGLDLSMGQLSSNEIIVTLPDKAALGELQLQTVSGDILCDPEDMTVKTAKFYTVSGDVDAGDLTANRADLQSVSGDLELEADVSQGVSAHSVSGDINLQGKLEGELKFDTVSGDVLLEIQGLSDQYQYDFSSVSGHIQAEGKSYKRSVSKGGSPNRISVTTVSGRIQLDFEKD